MTIDVIGEKGAFVKLFVAADGIPLPTVLLQHVLAEEQKGLLALVANVAGESHVGGDLGIDLQHALLIVGISFCFLRGFFCFAVISLGSGLGHCRFGPLLRSWESRFECLVGFTFGGGSRFSTFLRG